MVTNEQTDTIKKQRLKTAIIFSVTLILIIAITVVLFIFAAQNPEQIMGFKHYGYLGAFFIGLIFTASVILPAPGLLLLAAVGSMFNPILVGLVGAVGGTLGEMTGYLLGVSGTGLAQSNKYTNKVYVKAEGWMKKRGFLTVFLFSLIPILPIDVAGMIAGVIRFPIWQFLLACYIGKALLYIAMIQASAWGWEYTTRISR